MIAIYLRTSTEVEEGVSLEIQEQRCIDYAKAMGWKDWKIYKDDGHSGATTDRPAFQEMLRDAKKGEINEVVVWKVDRFSRSLLDAVDVLTDLREMDIGFHSVIEHIDLKSPFGKAIFSILAVFAELERENIVLRMREAKQKRMGEGLLSGGNPPIGYTYLNPKKAAKLGKKPGFYVDKKGAEMVRRVFELCADGTNQTQIAHKLMAEGFKTHQTSVRNILNRECYYTGKFENKFTIKERLKDGTKKIVRIIKKTIDIEPLIDKELWEKAQKVRRSHITYNRKPKYDFLFRGRIKCMVCGKNLFISNRVGGTYSYYGHDCSNGKRIFVDAHKLDSLIWDSLVKKLKDTKELKRTIKALKDETSQEKVKDLDLQAKAIEVEIGKLQRDKNKYAKQVLETDKKAAIEEYEREMEKLANRIKKLENSRDAIMERIADLQEMSLTIENAGKIVTRIKKRYSNLENLPFKEKKEIVQRLYPVSSIEYWPKWSLEKNQHGKFYEPGKAKLFRGLFVCNGLIDLDAFDEQRRGFKNIFGSKYQEYEN